MKPYKESYNVSLKAIPTELSATESKFNNDVSMNTITKDLSFKDRRHKIDSKEPLWKKRYEIVIVSFLIFFYTLYIRLNISVSIVAMVNNSAISNQELLKSESCQSLIQNFTESGKRNKMEGEFDWSPKIQGYVLGSYPFGQAATQMPAGFLVERYGAKWFLFGSTLIPAVCTLLIPLLSYLSLPILMVNLVLRGLLQGLIPPALTLIAANWLPKAERGFLFSFILSGTCLGSCLGSIFSALICDSAAGWPASFYVTGAWGIFIALLILFFLFENPKCHPRISKSEQSFILGNQENALFRKRPNPPWRKILTSVPVYALAIGLFGQTWALSLFWNVHSTFLATILHFPIRENGLLSALPFVVQFLASQITSSISFYIQKKKICGVDFLRKFWTLIASIGNSACLLGMYLSGCNRTLNIIFSILSMGCVGISFSGCWVVIPEMTSTFAGTLNAFCNSLSLSSSFLVPVVVGYLTDGMQTIEQWSKVFFLTIGIIMSSGIFFTLFGSAEVQPWNFVEDKNTEKDKIETVAVKMKTVDHKDQIRF